MTDRTGKCTSQVRVIYADNYPATPHWFVRSSYCPGVYSDPAKVLATIDNLTGAHVVQFSNQVQAVHALRVAIRDRTMICFPVPRPRTSQFRCAVLLDTDHEPQYVIVIRGNIPGVYEDAEAALTANERGGELFYVRAGERAQAYDIWRIAIDTNKVVATSNAGIAHSAFPHLSQPILLYVFKFLYMFYLCSPSCREASHASHTPSGDERTTNAASTITSPTVSYPTLPTYIPDSP